MRHVTDFGFEKAMAKWVAGHWEKDNVGSGNREIIIRKHAHGVQVILKEDFHEVTRTVERTVETGFFEAIKTYQEDRCRQLIDDLREKRKRFKEEKKLLEFHERELNIEAEKLKAIVKAKKQKEELKRVAEDTEIEEKLLGRGF